MSTYFYNATNKNGKPFLTTENLGTGGTINSQVPVLNSATGKIDSQFLLTDATISTKAELDALDVETLTVGDKYTVTNDPNAENNHTYIWTGTEWASYGGAGSISGVTLNGTSIVNQGVAALTVSTTKSNGVVLSATAGTISVTADQASTSTRGTVQLSDATNSTSSTTAATSKAVKSAYDLASSKISGITVTDGTTTSNSTAALTVEGDSSINVDVDSTGKITTSLNAAGTKTTLGLGSAAYASTGTSSGNVPVLDSNGKLNQSVLPALNVSEVITVPTAANIQAVVTAVNAATNATVGDLVIVAAGASAGQYIIASGSTGSFTSTDIVELATPADSIASITLNGKALPVTNSSVSFEAITTATEGDGINITVGTAANGSKSLTISGTSATGSAKGMVTLSDATNSTSGASAGIAATPAAVNSVYTLASGKISGITVTDGTTTSNSTAALTVEGDSSINVEVTSAGKITTSLNAAGTKTALGLGSAAYVSTGTASGNVPVLGTGGKLASSTLPTASTSAAGITQLVDNAASTSTTSAPTANALKQVADAKADTGTYNNKTATFTTAQLTTTSGGTYTLAGTIPVICVILSDGSICYPGIQVTGGNTILTFWDSTDDRATIYNGVFASTASTNQHTILLAAVTL